VSVRRTFWIIPVVLFVLDRLLKAAALQGLSFSFFSGALKFELFRNGGIAFSLPVSGPIVWIVTALILVAVGGFAMKDWLLGTRANAPAYVFFTLGALGNLIDRIAYGFTDDYLIFFNRSAVNLADAMILAGAIWLVLLPTKPKA
jgi:signal peptidase II